MSHGNCLCGAVTWELTSAPFAAYNCHCKMCRKAHGAAFGTYYRIGPDGFRWTSDTDSVVYFRSSHLLGRSSCRVCGSVVAFQSENYDGWAVPAGCHDQGRKVDCDIFVADCAPWHRVTGDLPRHDAYPDDTEYAIIPDTPLADQPDGVVRGSCLCGAVAYQVTEPFKAAYNCHCSRCRHGRSAAHASNGFTSFDGVQFVSGEDHLKTYKVPDARFFTQVFCDVCGSLMPRLGAERNVAVIPLGGLDDDPGIRPVSNIYVADKAGWHDITDDLPAYDEGPPG